MRNKLHAWWNRALTTKVKHLVTTFMLVVVILVGNQIQVGALNNRDRLADQRATYQIAVDQYHACLARVESRETLRELLLGVYDDVYVLLPESEVAREFNRRGHDRVDNRYPEYPPGYCGPVPLAP